MRIGTDVILIFNCYLICDETVTFTNPETKEVLDKKTEIRDIIKGFKRALADEGFLIQGKVKIDWETFNIMVKIRTGHLHQHYITFITDTLFKHFNIELTQINSISFQEFCNDENEPRGG